MTAPDGLRDEPQGWEPLDGQAWVQADPLTTLYDPETSFGYAGARAAQLLRLPIGLRRTAWREREILADLARYQEIIARIPGQIWIGVGRRDVGGRRLVGIVSVEAQALPDLLDVQRGLDMPATLTPGSRLPGVGDESVPIVFETSSPPVPYGVVPHDVFVMASETANRVTPTVQSGDHIAGENWLGVRTPGTLTAIVSREDSAEPLLLGAAHVLGQPGSDVIDYVPDSVAVGSVIEVEHALDAALAELRDPWQCDYRIKSLNAIPGAPTQPVSDMPVQLHGAFSSYLRGWVDQALTIPVGAGLMRIAFPFRVRMSASPGDSGALIVSGHGRTYSASGADGSPAALESLACSMLGMLVAGSPPATAEAAAWVCAIPLLEVLERFRLQPWIRQTE